MKETNYAFAVANVRANENKLLSQSDMEQLIGSQNIKTALTFLTDKGYGEIKNGDYEETLNSNLYETWELIKSIAPDKSVLDFLLVKNDYHNLKAVIKSTLSQRSNKGCFVKPCTVDIELIKTALQSGNYDALPEYIKEDLTSAYELAARTSDGQLTDALLDNRALKRARELAQKTEDEFIIEYVEKITAISNIKIALRGVRTQRDSVFFDISLCPCDTLDIFVLKSVAQKSEADLIEYLEKTDYASCTEYIKESNTAFEKWCENTLMAYMENAKTQTFGVAPIIAYYYAKETEIKNIRIVLSCIYNELPKEKIYERMRKLYV